MNTIDKIIYCSFALVIIGSVLYYSSLVNRIKAQEFEISMLQSQLLGCETRVKDAESAIQRQNTAIEAVRVDTVKVIERVEAVAKTYTTLRTQVVERIERDTSCENRLNTLTSVMRGFFGVQPENSNAN